MTFYDMPNMQNNDDSDMKIAGDSFDERRSLSADAETIEAFDKLRRSGDLSKARRLGASLAERVDEISSMAGVIDESELAMLHRRLLTVFSTVVAMEAGLGERILVRTALNAYYDTLKRRDPALYDAMSASGAVTFYYLKYRRLGDMPADIGGTFAMLCGRENDPRLIETGAIVFSGGYDFVRGFIDAMGFVK